MQIGNVTIDSALHVSVGTALVPLAADQLRTVTHRSPRNEA